MQLPLSNYHYQGVIGHCEEKVLNKAMGRLLKAKGV